VINDLGNLFYQYRRTLHEKGRKNYRAYGRERGGNYTNKYDLISQVIGSEMGLPRNEYLSPYTVKGIITRMRKSLAPSKSE